MSRIAKLPIIIPVNVDVTINSSDLIVNGQYGNLTCIINKAVSIKKVDNKLLFFPNKGYPNNWAITGTTRALVNNMVIGVTKIFTKKLLLVGVGYRVTVKNNVVNLFLGFSHNIDYKLPAGITAECISQTEILLKSADKQALGQVAMDLHSYRNPDPYKGKGIRYAEEIIVTKVAKKK
ncbi:50S ribosomal protein L6 [Candidatus Palibaumannia cicadellinicola]|uniref:50S ribosomal protein L6 n=1 Tax=Candidatus Palibaumannia cicadellinicola TaxID=186490 RepID=A0A0K2BL12_9GAMM|nr:50S ribosomal protein L6 [Candidatus Baumannia cicadellinicola]AKZ65887.1 LSU ribosomal protein L6p (L9e) [Candidatus Baumannia cicadellinicola]